jgi:hypothetical protein
MYGTIGYSSAVVVKGYPLWMSRSLLVQLQPRVL